MHDRQSTIEIQTLLNDAKKYILQNNTEALKNVLSQQIKETTIIQSKITYSAGFFLLSFPTNNFCERCLPALNLAIYGIELLTLALQNEKFDSVDCLVHYQQQGHSKEQDNNTGQWYPIVDDYYSIDLASNLKILLDLKVTNEIYLNRYKELKLCTTVDANNIFDHDPFFKNPAIPYALRAPDPELFVPILWKAVKDNYHSSEFLTNFFAEQPLKFPTLHNEFVRMIAAYLKEAIFLKDEKIFNNLCQIPLTNKIPSEEKTNINNLILNMKQFYKATFINIFYNCFRSSEVEEKSSNSFKPSL